MNKEDCKKGMLVQFGSDLCRGVVTKINPKRAEVASLDSHKSRPAGTTWRVPYQLMWPLVGGEEIATEMAMRSFQDPENRAVKAWALHGGPQNEVHQELMQEDAYIMGAIHSIFARLEELEGSARRGPSEKINLLFRAFGRDVSKEEARAWVERRRPDALPHENMAAGGPQT